MSDQLKIISTAGVLIIGIEKEADVISMKEKVAASRTAMFPQRMSMSLPQPKAINVIPNAAEPPQPPIVVQEAVNADKIADEMLSCFILTKPRMVQYVAEKNAFGLMPLFGKPEKITLSRTNVNFHYACEDAELEKHYLMETSCIPGLHLVK